MEFAENLNDPSPASYIYTRRAPRYLLNKEITYELSIGSNTEPRESDQKIGRGTLRNISEGGICIYTPFQLEESQIVKLGIPLAGIGSRVNVLAEVKWIKLLPSGESMAGMQFFV